ncbi:MAG: NB-ARC domain-containing protein [Coleofasciculus sp. B1-GNL1-01]|uniref:NB-ARC domain-containing protein n=1 Tax=Coleofasciculus sp. B1-GNL1-01 TaxID=3068484 RepID=UPI0032F8C734
MPRATYGSEVQARALRLFEALLSFVNHELEDGDDLDIKSNWREQDSAKPKLLVETKLRVLAELTRKDKHQGGLTKPHIREALHRMKDFLKILEDNRVQKKGKEEWRFTLTLWSKDKAENLKWFDQEWERLRPPKSKQQAGAIATAPQTVRCKPPMRGIPPLPPYFVERPETSQKLKQYLLSEKTARIGTLVVYAIYGLGGIGKSTLAAALTYDPEIQDYFPDGVLWVTLGQQPDLLSHLSRWIQELGDYDFKPTTIDTASMHLQRLLYDKAVLLVVDDVWSLDHFEPFRFWGTKCRLLVTTRENLIIDAIRYELDVMTQEQSLTLLENSVGKLSKTERQQAKDLAKTVGYLPLALELAAAQIANYQVSWAELLADLRQEIASLEALDFPGAEGIESEAIKKRYSLLASFNLSLKRLSPDYLQKFAWLGVLPEDATITSAMIVTLWQLNQGKAKKTLRDFQARALLFSGSPLADETSTYRLHDLWHDMARHLLTRSSAVETDTIPGLGLTLPQAHATLLEHYRAKTENNLWYTLPDDGYIHAHLTWHLEKAGWIDELHKLLQEETAQGYNGWYQACDHLGQLGSYVKDVARAWQLAEEAFESCPSQSLGWQYRYALIITSLKSLGEKTPPELIAALVNKQIWTPAQGLAYAQQIPYSGNRAEAIKKLAPHLPEALLPQALKIAREIQVENDRTLAMVYLATHFSQLLPEALEAVRKMHNEALPLYPLSLLIPHLPSDLLTLALAEARKIQDPNYRAYALAYLASHLPQIRQEALEAVQAIPNEWYRDHFLSTNPLIDLAPNWSEILPEALAAARSLGGSFRAHKLSYLAINFPQIFPEVLEAIEAIPDENNRALALSNIAPDLPSDLLEPAFNVARKIQNQNYQALALSNIAPRLPDIFSFSEILNMVRALPDEWQSYWDEMQYESYYLRALSNLALHSPDILPAVLEKVFQTRFSRDDTLCKLIPHLPPNLLKQALKLTQATQDELSRAYALTHLASYLPELFPEALKIARLIQDQWSRAKALIHLSSYFPEIREEALTASRLIQNEYSRAMSLGELVPHFPEICPEAFEVAQAIPVEYHRAIALEILAPHLPPILLKQAIEVAQGLHEKDARAIALSCLAPYLPESLPQALDAAINAESRLCTDALCQLIPYLPSNMLIRTLETARLMQNQCDCVKVLSHLACRLPDIFSEALEVTQAIPDENGRALALSYLVPNLPEHRLESALEIARAIQDENHRVFALRTLASRMPQIIPQALDSLRLIQDELSRARALSELTPYLKLFSVNVSLWQEILHILAHLPRHNFLENLVSLSPILVELGGSEALKETAQAIQDVGRWWS